MDQVQPYAISMIIPNDTPRSDTPLRMLIVCQSHLERSYCSEATESDCQQLQKVHEEEDQKEMGHQ